MSGLKLLQMTIRIPPPEWNAFESFGEYENNKNKTKKKNKKKTNVFLIIIFFFF